MCLPFPWPDACARSEAWQDGHCAGGAGRARLVLQEAAGRASGREGSRLTRVRDGVFAGPEVSKGERKEQEPGLHSHASCPVCSIAIQGRQDQIPLGSLTCCCSVHIQPVPTFQVEVVHCFADFGDALS